MVYYMRVALTACVSFIHMYIAFVMVLMMMLMMMILMTFGDDDNDDKHT